MSTKKRGLALSKSNGFTLIELLVVIAIIGLLASIILASLDSARKKGRDARRVADVKQIQLALELFYDANNTFPVQAYGSLPSGLASTYISSIPTDPTNSSPYVYQYASLASDGTTACTSGSCPNYIITANLESANNSSSYVNAATFGASAAPCTTSSSAPYHYCAHS